MIGAFEYFQLMCLGELVEIDRITGHADGDVRIQLGVLHRRDQLGAVEHVHVQVVRTLPELPVEHVRQIFRPVLVVLAQSGWNDGEGV